MNKKEYDKASSIVLGMEAIERGKLDLAIEFFKNADVSERSLAVITSGKDVDSIISSLRGELELSVSVYELAKIYSGNDVSKEAKELVEKAFKYFNRGEHGTFSVRSNSPMLMPKYNQRQLTETSGADLIGTITRSDLTELPNLIPTLQKIGVTYNYVEGVASKQSIPSIITNAPVADILNNVVVGSLDDPEFDLCPGEVNLLTTQLPLSRRFFIQSSETAKELLNQMMFNIIQDALMYRTLNGLAASGQCVGLYNNSDIEKISGASFDDVIGNNVMQKVHTNEAPSENCLWLINAAIEEKLKTRPIGVTNRMMIEKNLLLDKPYVLSERVTAGQMYYGAFQSVVLTLFNLEILIDPYSGSSNEVTIKQWQPYSMDVRHPGWIKCVHNFT